MVIFWIVLSIMGCGETSPETLVDELRVIASVASPPEVRPGEPFEYTSFIANPNEDEFEALTWVCTNFGDGCLEASGGAPSISTALMSGTAPTIGRDLGIAPALALALPETGPVTATQVWTLLCEKGECPIIEAVGDTTGMEEWPEDIQEDLSNPLEWMTETPSTGTSLAYQLITSSLSDTPHTNPTIRPNPANPGVLDRDEAFSLEFRVTGTLSEDARLYPYISAGGFEMTDTFVTTDDCTILNGVAPKKGDEVTIWVVLLDGFGGVDVWSSQLEVR